jgi:gamma-glutamylcysteine synthetase
VQNLNFVPFKPRPSAIYKTLVANPKTDRPTKKMSFDLLKSIDIIELMENYISSVRPEPEIRNKLDLNYEITDQSVILTEIRPVWNNPHKLITISYAKATFVKSKNVWKIFWKRADNKWHSYKPKSTVKELKDIIIEVEKNKYGCFKS